MFDELNTEGYTPGELKQMNEELAEELDNYDEELDGGVYGMDYQEYYKYACKRVLKRWDGA